MLFELMVVPALWAAITQARPAACFIRGVVLIVAGGGRSAADRAGAGGVAYLGQVPEPGAGVVAFGLEAVVAVPGGKGLEFDEEFPAEDCQFPDAMGAGRPVAAGAGEAEGGLRPVPAPGGSRGPGAAPFSASGGFRVCAVAGGCWLGAGVPGGVPVVVGHGDAPGRLRVRRGGVGQVAGEPGVDGGAGQLAGPAGQAEQGGQRDGQSAAGGEPGGGAVRPGAILAG